MQIIILDGSNGTGKSTLRHELMQRMNYDVLTIDRFTPSIWVYDRLRGIDRRDVLEFEEKFDKLNPLIVICKCIPEIAKKRTQDNVLRKINFNIEDQDREFDIYYSKYSRYRNLIRVNTELPIEDCIKKIIERL